MDGNGNVTRAKTDRNTVDIRDLRADFEQEQRRNAARAEETSRWRGEVGIKIDTILASTVRRRTDSTKITVAVIGSITSIIVALVSLLALLAK